MIGQIAIVLVSDPAHCGQRTTSVLHKAAPLSPRAGDNGFIQSCPSQSSCWGQWLHPKLPPLSPRAGDNGFIQSCPSQSSCWGQWLHPKLPLSVLVLGTMASSKAAPLSPRAGDNGFIRLRAQIRLLKQKYRSMFCSGSPSCVSACQSLFHIMP